MSVELDLYTGKLTYKDIEFDFVFDKSELRLIPPKYCIYCVTKSCQIIYDNPLRRHNENVRNTAVFQV